MANRNAYCDAGCGCGLAFELEEVKKAWRTSLASENEGEEIETVEPDGEEEENIQYLLHDWIKEKSGQEDKVDVVVLQSKGREQRKVLVLLQHKHIKMTGDSNSIDYTSLPLDFLMLTQEDQELLQIVVERLGLGSAEPRLQCYMTFD